MSTLSVRLPDSLHDKMKKLSKNDTYTMDVRQNDSTL
jgi:predicted DNA-binding protein